MNRIYWDEDRIGLMTNHIDSIEHSHWMLQLFLSIQSSLDIKVANQAVTGKCVLVNKNIPHRFKANGETHFSLLIDPASSLAEKFGYLLGNESYLVCDYDGIEIIQRKAECLMCNHSVEEYLNFMKYFDSFFGIESKPIIQDDRIAELKILLESCECDDHSISKFAESVFLSPSRLSHLFKEQTGVPLKSYILLHQIEKGVYRDT